jgi:hypothetical protein
MTLREFHSQFGTQYTWYLEQQAQWRLRQQRAAWLQQQQQQQLEVQLRDGSMTAAAAAPGGEGASKQTLAAAVAAAFASAATSSAAPGAEVYYCAEGETASPSAAYASFSDHDDGSSVHGENMFQQRQQQQLFSPPGQKSAASQQDVHQPGEMQHWRLQQQQGLPPIRWPLQQQLQQQQHSPHQAPHDSSSSRYPHAQLANSMRRAVSRRQAAMAAAQLSGFEMYGTWLGCLVQPVDDVVLLQEQLQQEQ